MEKKSICEKIELKAEEGRFFVEGYAAVYGNVDTYKDIIAKGAFDEFLLSPDAKRVRFCAEHNITNVIGVVEELKSDDYGLFFRAKLSNTTMGKDYAELLQDGAVSEFSIGYKTEDSIYKDDGVRVLNKLYLYEFSVVSRAANDKAVITSIDKKDEGNEPQLKDMTYEQLQSELNTTEARCAAIQSEMDNRIIQAININ